MAARERIAFARDDCSLCLAERSWPRPFGYMVAKRRFGSWRYRLAIRCSIVGRPEVVPTSVAPTEHPAFDADQREQALALGGRQWRGRKHHPSLFAKSSTKRANTSSTAAANARIVAWMLSLSAGCSDS